MVLTMEAPATVTTGFGKITWSKEAYATTPTAPIYPFIQQTAVDIDERLKALAAALIEDMGKRPMVQVDEFMEALERAVAKRGSDWSYPQDRNDRTFRFNGTCVYSTPSGEAACIIGAVMDELGLTRPAYDCTVGAESVLGARVSPEVRRLAGYAQGMNDSGVPWGQIVDRVRAAKPVRA